MNEKLPFLVIGHRGCVENAPENTLKSVRKAIDCGCKCIEIDIYMLNGRLLIHHDKTVDRTSNGSGLLNNFSFDALRALDFGEGERIPLLEEVLDLCKGMVTVNIEIKGNDAAETLVQLLHRRNYEDNVIISSFDWRQLFQVKLLSDLSIAILVRDVINFAKAVKIARELNAKWINVSLKMLSTDRVNRAHAEGLLVAVYTVKNLRDLKLVLENDADGCFVDNPEMAFKYLCKR